MKDDGHDTCRDREAEMFEKAHDYMLQNNALRAELAELRERATRHESERNHYREKWLEADREWKRLAPKCDSAERDLAKACALLARAPETLDAQWDADRRAFLARGEEKP